MAIQMDIRLALVAIWTRIRYLPCNAEKQKIINFEHSNCTVRVLQLIITYNHSNSREVNWHLIILGLVHLLQDHVYSVACTLVIIQSLSCIEHVARWCSSVEINGNTRNGRKKNRTVTDVVERQLNIQHLIRIIQITVIVVFFKWCGMYLNVSLSLCLLVFIPRS